MKKLFHRKIRTIGALLLSAALLFGCGASAENTQVETGQDSMITDSQLISTESQTATSESELISTESDKFTTEIHTESTESGLTSTDGKNDGSTEEGNTKPAEMKVHFLNVEQGLSILVQSEDEVLVYDGGDRGTSSFVVSYLKQQGVTTIDYLISSHYDSDHVYGLIGCLNAFDVENVISSNYVHDSQTYDKFLTAVDKEGLIMQHPSVGTTYEFGSGEFTILAPQVIDSDANANSVAIKVECQENSFVFTGDATIASEAAMIGSGLDLSCDVLSVGHHGSATSTSWDFLVETVPEYAVISCGKDNSYGHPHVEVMEKLESMEIAVFRTDIQGTIVAVSDGKTITWSANPCNDYTPGETETSDTSISQTVTPPPSSGAGTNNNANEGTDSDTTPQDNEQQQVQTEMVWISATGSKYHNKNNCGNMNPNKATQMTREEAEDEGYEACKKCY